MSDEPENWPGSANIGPTFPDGLNATYNVALSPIFAVRTGLAFSSSTSVEKNLAWRGLAGYAWSSSIKNATANYFFGVGIEYANPSDYNGRSYTYSLRCLVSATNS